MAYKAIASKGALTLFMVSCMVTSAMSRSSHVGVVQPESQLSIVALAPDVAQVMDTAKEFYPCLRNLQHLEGCSVVDLLTVVFGYTLTESCCQVVLYVGTECLSRGWYSDKSLPEVVKKCIWSSPAQDDFSVFA